MVSTLHVPTDCLHGQEPRDADPFECSVRLQNVLTENAAAHWLLSPHNQGAFLKPSSWHCFTSSAHRKRRYRRGWYHGFHDQAALSIRAAESAESVKVEDFGSKTTWSERSCSSGGRRSPGSSAETAEGGHRPSCLRSRLSA